MEASGELRQFLHSAESVQVGRAASDESWESRVAWQSHLHSAGWCGAWWPREHGGRGLTLVDRIRCDIELARAGVPIVAGVLGVQNVGPTIIAHGTDAQRSHLSAIQSGKEIWAQGFSEPGAGSDLAAVRTRATMDGDEFVIDGQKVWTSEGMRATHMMLLARTTTDGPKHKGISVILLPMDLPGIDRRPLKQITGESEFAEVFFTGVRVPLSGLLGGLHDGWRVTMSTLGHERAGVISMAAALEQEVTVMISANGKVADPTLRELLVRQWIDARVVGLLGQQALAQLSAGEQPGAGQSVIKLAWSKARQTSSEVALQLRGPHGALRSTQSQELLHYRSATIAAGTTEIMKNILAEQVLGLAKG